MTTTAVKSKKRHFDGRTVWVDRIVFTFFALFATTAGLAWYVGYNETIVFPAMWLYWKLLWLAVYPIFYGVGALLFTTFYVGVILALSILAAALRFARRRWSTGIGLVGIIVAAMLCAGAAIGGLTDYEQELRTEVDGKVYRVTSASLWLACGSLIDCSTYHDYNTGCPNYYACTRYTLYNCDAAFAGVCRLVGRYVGGSHLEITGFARRQDGSYLLQTSRGELQHQPALMPGVKW